MKFAALPGASILLVSIITPACAPGLPHLNLPSDLQPASTADARAWARSTGPTGHADWRFSWKYRDQDQSLNGRGSVQFAAPDSLRLNFRGPIGIGAEAAALVGDSIIWQPEKGLQQVVPSYPLIWAMIGMARPPGRGWNVSNRITPSVAAWRYVRGADTVTYVLQRGATPVMSTYVSQDGHAVGRATVSLDASGRPRKARLEVLNAPARLDLTFDADARVATFTAEIWNAPQNP